MEGKRENCHEEIIWNCINYIQIPFVHKLVLHYDMIYLLTAIGLSPVGSSTVHIYTQTVHRTIQNKQYIEQHNNF
jgi:hypothetical protein